jgi:hypothetical protein
VLSVLPRVQRLKMGQAMARQVARVWADEVTVHVTVAEQFAKTVPSSLDAEDLAELRMRGAALAGPPPATPAPARAALSAGSVIEVSRTVNADGNADLAGNEVKIGAELARGRVTLRLDGHLLHVIRDGALAMTRLFPPKTGRGSAARGSHRCVVYWVTVISGPLGNGPKASKSLGVAERRSPGARHLVRAAFSP